jgi:hypothetical protein
METTVPATSVTLDDHNRHGQHHFPWLGITEKDAIAGLSNKVGDVERYLTSVTEKNGAAGTVTSEKIGAAAAVTSEKIGAAGALAACKIGDEICASTSEVKNALGFGFDRSQERDCLTQTQIGALGTSVVSYAKDAQATAYQIEGRSQLALSERANAIGVQADKNFYALSVEAVKNASASELTAERNFNALGVQAEKIASAAALAAQECCCKLEAKITAEGVSTRELINAIDGRRSDRELIRAENKIGYLLSRVPAGTPV